MAEIIRLSVLWSETLQIRTLITALLATLCVLFLPFAANAQMLATSSDPVSSEYQPLIDEAKEKGLNIIIIGPDAPKEEVVKQGTTITEDILAVRKEFKRLASRIPYAFVHFENTLKAASPDGTWWWLVIALATAAGGLAAATFISWRVRLIIQPHMSKLFNPEPETRLEKISFLMLRAGVILFNCFVMLASAFLVAVIFDQDHEPTRATIMVIVLSWVSYWVFRAVILFNIIAHDLPNHRMINLDDDAAKKLQYESRNSIVAVIIALGICTWMDLLGLDRDIHKLFLIAAILIATIIFVWLTIRHAKSLQGIVMGAGEPELKPAWRRLFAYAVPVLLSVYLVVAGIISVLRTVMELPSALVLIAAPSIAFFVGIAAYGLALILIDRFYIARQERYEVRVEIERARVEKLRESEEKARLEAMTTDEDEDEQVIINRMMASHKLEEMPAFKPIFKPLIESAAGILIVIVAVGFVLGVWDISVGEQGNPITAFMDTLVLLFAGWLAYRVVAIYIDSKLEDEGPEEEVDSEGEGGQGATRVQTLLPLVRNVLIATIAIIVGMIVLSSMGVDIAPLFAGAGVIGLAVGFGAQTLIRDIFSGGFFLFDDAFRKGEYIELDNIRGTVEKISLRSFQLRHHNGPLHTVPFGEIKQLTNYSRDWVIMKLPLRVTYDTDVERVRKLVKKLGQELLEHPDVGKTFLQPLKSQGVYRMEDSAMLIRVKFMTRPGEQWVTRKVVYAAIRDLFEREGIKFAHKEVTVRLADEPAQPLSEEQKKVVSAAAREAVDADIDIEAIGAGGDDDR